VGWWIKGPYSAEINCYLFSSLLILSSHLFPQVWTRVGSCGIRGLVYHILPTLNIFLYVFWFAWMPLACNWYLTNKHQCSPFPRLVKMIVTMKLKAPNSVVGPTYFDVLCHSYAISWGRATTLIRYLALLVCFRQANLVVSWSFGVLLVVCNILDMVTGRMLQRLIIHTYSDAIIFWAGLLVGCRALLYSLYCRRLFNPRENHAYNEPWLGLTLKLTSPTYYVTCNAIKGIVHTQYTLTYDIQPSHLHSHSTFVV
jgi:hypothetical protein